jgi:hypothetical protein
MKKNNRIFYIAALTLVMAVMTGCHFLDHNPDMRASIDTKDKVRLLLVSAYTNANAGVICEFSSDNVIDNNSPDAYGHCNALLPLDKMYDEIFSWRPVVSSTQQDSPTYIWDGCYSAIAACNQALLAIEELEKKGINMDAEKGEALMSRAYHHFLLATVFCHTYKDEAQSRRDSGIHYMTVPETTVKPVYYRGTVYDTYKHIQEDIEAALPLVNDEYYTVPRYHFNIRAAHAFAARFYLYTRQWDKVLPHANYVLSTNDEATLSVLFDATYAKVECTDITSELNAWIDANSPANLLIYTTMSQASYTAFSDYGRYQFNRDARNFTTSGSGPCWKSRFPGFSVWSANSEYGSLMAWFYYLFEYTDKVNGYGYIHGVTRAFTTNETLLCRAEAKAQLGDLDGAVNDLRMWAQSYNVQGQMDTLANGNVNLTLAKIKNFYNADGVNPNWAPVLHTNDICPGWVLSNDQLAVIRCALHFRRLEGIHTGLRWHDLKRYGIEIEHYQGTDPVRKLVWNDDRRAIQLPQEVINAGMAPNVRVNLGDNVDGNSSFGVAPASSEPVKVSMLEAKALGAQITREN